MTKKIKLSEITDVVKDVQILSLEGVNIEGDTELDLGGLGSGFDPMLAAAIGQECAMLAQQFSRLNSVFSVPVGRGAPKVAPAVSPSCNPKI
ncbi:CO dehydrogenase/acetyl-CoA synthase subunit delta, corrinoid iron-sulfur subcomplex small subunit [Methanosarcina barkeri str. Wiesmoor]|uniref:CO dehydrogenase/acetyl-CoA synthase subunit delta, corrinoid iron-sulfur subcomplex small subunit n=2 Tax=Methanosarcina barkeri TaxID=2208 RepID=A0A0E3QPH9_METBA|nr:CO dehydrogenase/acetyl-CoA synthase subunit delta, corrinoid iron-sulfur subcomplex small subunit [Methanosarcina barkeri str. Wiesmoor]